MVTLIRGGEIYSPLHLGRGDLLLENDTIAAVGPKLPVPLDYPGLRVIDATGYLVVPGFIDLHAHILGGGGEDGFTSRSPESRITDFTTAGVTTVLGLLGTDGICRSLEALYAKACALQEAGLTCYMLTGSYAYPSVSLCGSPERDLILIDRVQGTKIALSDHRSSELTYEELLRLATQVRRGALLAGKAGILTIHMGDGRARLSQLFRAAEESEVPLSTFLPTHLARNEALFADAVCWLRQGGQGDFTAGETTPGGTARYLARALREGAPLEQMTMSSDAFGSQPRFDREGRCVGLTYVTSHVLLEELRNLVQEENIPLEKALTFLTSNPARVLGKRDTLGCIAPGAQGDLLLLKPDLTLDTVIARGRMMIEHGKVLVKDRFTE